MSVLQLDLGLRVFPTMQRNPLFRLVHHGYSSFKKEEGNENAV